MAKKTGTTRTTLSKEERQLLVLSEAVKLLSEGSDELKVKDIAERLGWSARTVSRLYRYRADILMALLGFAKDSMQHIYTQLKQEHNQDGLALARDLFVHFVEFTDANPAFVRVLTGRVFRVEEPKLSEELLALHTMWEKWIRESMKVAILNETVPVTYDAESRAFMLFNSLVGRWTRQSMNARVPTLTKLMPSVDAMLKGDVQ